MGMDFWNEEILAPVATVAEHLLPRMAAYRNR
jgi:hypothetical protein